MERTLLQSGGRLSHSRFIPATPDTEGHFLGRTIPEASGQTKGGHGRKPCMAREKVSTVKEVLTVKEAAAIF